jgi:hypothetical protein
MTVAGRHSATSDGRLHRSRYREQRMRKASRRGFRYFSHSADHEGLQEASELMAREGLGRLPVVKRESPRKVVAILSGSDVRPGIRRRLEAADQAEQTLHWP